MESADGYELVSSELAKIISLLIWNFFRRVVDKLIAYAISEFFFISPLTCSLTQDPRHRYAYEASIC